MFRFRDTRASAGAWLALVMVFCTALSVPLLSAEGAETTTPRQASPAVGDRSLMFAPQAGAGLEEARPRRNFGADPGLRVDGDDTDVRS
jgi:hypothetical protein